MNKPYSESCDQNREPIRAVLDQYAPKCHTVLEIGSGTGQHAVYFAACYPHVIWQTSDLVENHAAINAWIDDSALQNVLRPIELDARANWPEQQYDMLYTANSLHIMSEQAAEQFIRRAPGCMHQSSVLMIYGPFNYRGQYTSASNERFDGWLKQRNPASGIKHFEWLDGIATESGLSCVDDIAMPANNRILIMRKTG